MLWPPGSSLEWLEFICFRVQGLAEHKVVIVSRPRLSTRGRERRSKSVFFFLSPSGFH